MFSFGTFLPLCIPILLLPFSVLATPLPLPFEGSHRLPISMDWAGYQYYDDADLGSYSYGYDIDDPITDNLQYRNEEHYENGTISGSYGYLQPDGNIHMVEYVADQFGYRARVRIIPRGQLKPVPVSDATVHYDVNSDIDTANINNPWRQTTELKHHKQQHRHPPGHVAHPQATVSSLLLDINGQPVRVALGRNEVVVRQESVLEISPGFMTVNEGVNEAPSVVYPRK